MVQILENNQKGFLQSLLGGAAGGAKATGELIPQLMKQQQQQRQQDFLNKLIGMGQSSNQGAGQVDQNQPSGVQEDSNYDVSNIPDEAILGLGVDNPQAARIAATLKDTRTREKREKQTAKERKFEADRAYHAKRAEPIIESANNVIKQAPIKKGLTNQLKQSISSGNASGLGQYLADKTGLEIFRSPESAQFSSAIKHRFIENLNSIGGGARPNMFIEQMLAAAQPAIGRSEEANLAVVDMEDFIDDLTIHRAKLELDIAKEDREKYGYERNDIAERANERMGDYAEKRQEKMAMDIRQRHEDKLDNSKLTEEIVLGKVPQGAPLTPRMANILMIKNNDDPVKAHREAIKLGFVIPSEYK